jgi:hypothetical protein
MKGDRLLSDGEYASKKPTNLWITSRRSVVCFLRRTSLALAMLVCLTSPCSDFLSAAIRLQAQERQAPAAQRIRASDIGISIEIVGRLGSPLGEVLTVQGKWSSWDASGREVLLIKETGPRFLVTAVNGKQLNKPVDFRGALVSPIVREAEMPDIHPDTGDVWELRVIEVGGYRGVPAAAYKEAFPTMPAMALRFGFYTELRYFSPRIVRRGKGENEPKPESSVL